MEKQRVIKSGSLRELGHKVLFDFEDFQKRCDDHLSETRQQAQRYLTEAQQEAITLEQQARQQGFEAGYAAGMQKAEEAIRSRAEAKAKVDTLAGLEDGRKILESLAKAIADAKVEWLTRWETTAIQLCVCIAEKIIRAELEQRPNLSPAMIRKLLEVASSEQCLIARVHPEDALLLEDSPDSPGQYSRFQQIVEFRPDAGLRRGDCVVELEQGQLDGRVSTQLQRLSEELVPREEPPASHE